MKLVRTLASAGVAALAIAMLAVASASAAAPELGRCLTQAGGKFSDAGCTKKVTKGGKFEWTSTLVKNHFGGRQNAGTLATLETVGKTKITCTASEAEGKNAVYNSPKTVAKLVAHFSGCETSKLECNSAGEAKGHITTFALKGELRRETSTRLEFQLTPESGTLLAKFECSAIKVEVRGCVAHPITENKMLLTSTEKFAATKGEQKPDKALGGPADECALESNSGKGFEEAGQTLTSVLENEEPIEASTVN